VCCCGLNYLFSTFVNAAIIIQVRSFPTREVFLSHTPLLLLPTPAAPGAQKGGTDAPEAM